MQHYIYLLQLKHAIIARFEVSDDDVFATRNPINKKEKVCGVCQIIDLID